MKTELSLVLDLALARTLVARDVDNTLGAHHGLGLSDLALLLELRSAPQGRMRRVELANRLGVTTSGVARQLGQLERRKIVTRESNPADARLALAVLTGAGEKLLTEALVTAEEEAELALARHWSSAERQRLGKLLSAVRS
ncbi:MAG TPA: MarR family transcriptional regulator [Gaiellaceae bacterium]|jgi:DNA-binding MarR family transcriptional regulator